MQPLSLEMFANEAQAFDRCVLAMPDIDRFCSSTHWVIPAHEAFLPRRSPRLFRGAHGYVAMMSDGETPEQVWQPLEAMWGLATPLVTSNPIPFARELLEHLRENEGGFFALLLTGMPRGSELWLAVARALSTRYAVHVSEETLRHVADLGDGYEAFLSRRSSNFRRNLQRGVRRANELGISFEHIDDTVSYERILRAEARTWKGREGVGFGQGDMKTFYERMLPRLIAARALRVTFARQDEQDVGFLFGAVFGDTYRALQFGYDEALAKVGLGHLLQAEAMQRLVLEGVTTYDLGTDVPYKAQWSDRLHATLPLIVRSAPG